MTLAVNTITGRVATQLHDTANTRWSAADLVSLVNEAQVSIIKKVPTAYTKTSTETLVAGTQQSIPTDGYELIDVVRNMTGATPGNVVRMVDMKTLDAVDPTWHTATGASPVEEFMYDLENKNVFYVNPPQPATPTEVQLVYSAEPPTASAGGNLILDDIYENALIEFMLYRALSRDAEYSGPEGKAAIHYEQFIKELS